MNRGRALRQLSSCLRGESPPGADWDSILGLANEALVTPELHRTLVEKLPGGPAPPEDVCAFLTDVRRRNDLRNASLFETLKDALAVLNASGIEPVLLKGSALWPVQDHLNEPPDTGRLSADLDLLVPGQAFQSALETLTEAGFSVLSDNRSQVVHPVVVVGRGKDAGSVDLHQFPPGPRGLPEIERLAESSCPVSFGGFQARVPPPELQILIAVLHDQLVDGRFWRGGFELRHLLDIRTLAKRTPPPDWSALQFICGRAGIGSALTAQLFAAKHVAGADIPDALLRDPLGRLHYWRQRAQFVWPAINAPFHAFGLNKRLWRLLSFRRLAMTSA
jgi:hypothetical protein